MHASHPPPHAGYSLPEVLAVVVIIGIIAAMAAPRFDLSRHRSEAAVHGISSTLMAAQRAAVGRQHNVVVAFDAAGRRMLIHQDQNNDGLVDAGEPVRFEVLPQSAVFGRGGAVQHPRLGAAAIGFTARRDGLPIVTFNRSGSASEEGGVYVTSLQAQTESNRPSVARAVVVERASGRPTVFRYGVSGWEVRF